MDSLVVLRRPLNKVKSEAKFIKPVKAKKSVSPRVSNDAEESLQPLEKSHEEPVQMNVSFVQLYNDLCVHKNDDGDKKGNSVAGGNAMERSLGLGRGRFLSDSADSVLKTYLAGKSKKSRNSLDRPKVHKMRVRTEVVLEMDYNMKASSVCGNKNSSK